MANFEATTAFILGHPQLQRASGHLIEESAHEGTAFDLTATSVGIGRIEFDLHISGRHEYARSIPPDLLAEAIRAGGPLLPRLLKNLRAPDELVRIAELAVREEMNVLESFSLGAATVQVVFEGSPLAVETPRGYRLTVRAPKKPSRHFALSPEVVASAYERSEPVLGGALSCWPGAAGFLAEEIGAAAAGIKTAYQSDVDKAAMSTASASSGLPPGTKRPTL